MTQLSEKLSGVLVKIEKLEHQSVITHIPNHGVPDVTAEVYKSLADVNRRKSNIVVSGLPETPASSTNGANDPVNPDPDRKAFEPLCEEHFSIKPNISKFGCRRLGKHTDGQRPRKLLVHLDSQRAVSTLLAEAKKLRQSDNAVIASSVYINPDLPPTELKLAYERRNRRRTLRLGNGQMMSSEPQVPSETHSSPNHGTADMTLTSGNQRTGTQKPYTVINSSFRN